MKRSIIPALILCFATVSYAQTFRGGIQGTVTDPNGAVIPGAEVTITNPETGLTRTTQTDSEGGYLVSELPIGTYQVTVKKAGFHDLTVRNVKVEVSTTTRADVPLLVAGGADVIDVPSGAPSARSRRGGGGGRCRCHGYSLR